MNKTVSKLEFPGSMNKVNRSLLKAVAEGDTDAANVALSSCANILIAKDVYGNNAADIAYANNHEKAAHYLISEMAKARTSCKLLRGPD